MRNIPLEDTSLLSAIQKEIEVLLMCYFKSTIQCSAPTAIVLSGWKMQKRLFRTSCYGFGKTAKDPVIEYSLKQYLFKAVYHVA